jgi:glycosyltransferase involved in cell wall biosynthesis
LSGTAARASLGVAIPSLGQAAFVAAALRSLQLCTFEWRAIIQDGGSDDETLDLIRATIDGDARFELVVESDGGQADAINRAWRRLLPAHEFVTWINTDDVVHPHGLAACVRELAHSRDIVAAYGDFLLIDEDGLVIDLVRPPRTITRHRLLYGWNLMPGVATVVRSAAVERTGLLDTSLNYAMDYDLWLRLSRVGHFVRVDQPCFSFRVHRGSKTVAGPSQSLAEEAKIAQAARRLPKPVSLLATKCMRAMLIWQRYVGARGFVQRSTGEPYRQPG